MHSYLRSIGFGMLETKKEEERLLHLVVENATAKKMISVSEKDDALYAEISFEVAPGIGITVRGIYDETDMLHVDHYFPYLYSENISTNEDLFIGKRTDDEAYTALCEDYRVGVSLIFYLQNAVDYRRRMDRDRGPYAYPTALSALASEGVILLPTEKAKTQIKASGIESKRRSKMLAEAKNGNQDAIDKLTIEEIDAYSSITKRLKNEDVFSIVDTSFMPYGMESEIYRILGIVLSVEEKRNRITDEALYVLEVYCNHMIFHVCVAARDLLGEPEVGRRFRGVVWMQGRVEFPA